MNAMAEKLKDAGVDTLGARLTAACIEAIRKNPDSSVEAWRQVGYAFGHEFVRGLMNDMQRSAPQKQGRSPPPPLSRDNHPIGGGVAAYKPRVIPPERMEKRRELQQIVRSKYKNSGGVAWSDVSWHELHGLKRDGVEAMALLKAGPANAPNGHATVGEVLGVQRVDEIIMSVRS